MGEPVGRATWVRPFDHRVSLLRTGRQTRIRGPLMGRVRTAMWRLIYPNKFDIDGFSELFLQELDSMDAGDIACCDGCYDDYAKTWPGIAASDLFQSIP